MKNKLLSVIIPAYNISGFLKNAIISLDGMLDNIKVEILIINDGSTDNTLQIANELAQKFENVSVYDKENGGLSDTRNYGSKLAIGKYIYFFDGDDYLNEESRLILPTLELKSPDILCFGYAKVDENHNVITKHLLNYNDEVEQELLTFKKVIQIIVGRDDEPIAGYLPTKIIKRSLIKDQKFLKMNYEDLPFIFKLAEKEQFNVLYLNQIIYNYVQRNQSITHSVSEQNLLDKLYSLELVKNSLNRITNSSEIINLNKRRSLIAILWVSSLNRQIQSTQVAKVAYKQLKELTNWAILERHSKLYLRLKVIYYLFKNSSLRRKE